ncbi:MAG: hypothetical protein GC153_05445 [Alphaproteobacteria bacterium]|nr:hypothetical protein [Alphaproteobacteria bacterium]
MALALTALIWAASLTALARLRVFRHAAGAPALMLVAGAAISVILRALGENNFPTNFVSDSAESGFAALVFASAAQLRVTRLARRCPAAFRLTLGGAPLFLFVSSLAAFVLLPQLSLPAALVLGAALMLNGAAFDRRAVTETSAPATVKATVRTESAAIIAFGAPVAILLAANATAPNAHEAPLGPLLAASIDILKGFALGGAAGFIAARIARRYARLDGAPLAVAAGVISFALAAIFGADPVIAAGGAGLIWGEQTTASPIARLRIRGLFEKAVAPAAYFLFGVFLAPRVFQADMLSILFAAAAVTVMRAGPRLAMLQAVNLPKESQAFLAWFGGAPGAASALFILSLIDEPAIIDHEAILTVGALSVVAGVFAARLTSRPLANAFLRQTALAKKRRMYAG